MMWRRISDRIEDSPVKVGEGSDAVLAVLFILLIALCLPYLFVSL
jgi:hypothetical protein